MKIALLSDYSIDDYKTFKYEKFWSTPKGIYNAFKRNPIVTEIRSYPLPKEDKIFGFRELKKQYDSLEYVPDLILLMNAGPLDDSYWNHKTFPNSYLVYEAGDEPQTFHWNQVKAINSNLIITPDYNCSKHYSNKGLNCIWTSHWTDMDIFYKDESYEPFDVVSSMYGDRGDIVPYLQSSLNKSFYLKNNLLDIENGDFFRRGKIVFQKSRYAEITRRIYEGMSCGKLVITDRLPENTQLSKNFIEDEDIVYYSSKEEALMKIRYFLTNDKERKRIAMNGYKKTVERFTTDCIVDKILKEALQ